MRNLIFYKIALFISAGILVQGCASQPKPQNMKALLDQGPVQLVLNPVLGAADRTDYRSRTITKTYTNGEISRKISEGVDFTVDTKITHVDSLNKVGTYEVTTISKDGKTDLSDFAMPEVGESFEYVLAADGHVLRAGQMPPGTLYFVPPVSLPKGEVQVGESWPMTADWISLKSGVPLRMEIVSILKNIRDCGAAGRCAEIEISGDVTIVGAKNNVLSATPLDDKDMMMRFRSDIRGRILLSMQKGTVLYSIVRSDEALSGVKDSVQISSCMLSYVTEPATDNVLSGRAVDCDPVGEMPTF